MRLTLKKQSEYGMFCPGWQKWHGMLCPGWQKWHGMLCPGWQKQRGMFCPGWQIFVGCFVRGVKKWHGMFCPGMFCPAPNKQLEHSLSILLAELESLLQKNNTTQKLALLLKKNCILSHILHFNVKFSPKWTFLIEVYLKAAFKEMETQANKNWCILVWDKCWSLL